MNIHIKFQNYSKPLVIGLYFVEHNNNITIQAGFGKAILFVLSFISEMSDRSTYKVYQSTTVRELGIELRFLTGTRLWLNIALKYDILKASCNFTITISER